MSDETDVKRLLRQRIGHVAYTRKCAATIKDLCNVTVSDFTEENLQTLESMRDIMNDKLEVIHAKNEKIEQLIDEEELEDEIMKASSLLDEFTISRKTADAMIAKVTAARKADEPTISPSDSPSKPKDDLKLPRIELPKFSGKYSEWTAFAELFVAAVHEKSSLSDCQKMQYLKTSLRDEALKTISSLPLTNANYKTAWDMLVMRYDNKRAIVRSHIHAICTVEKLKPDCDAKSIRRLITTVQENYMALESHSIDMEAWDSILIYLVAEKLDDKTRRDWELESPGTSLQEYKELIEFLSNTAGALEAAPRHNSHKGANASKNSQPQSRGTTSYHTSKSDCLKCGGYHRLYQCKEFLDLNVDERRQIVSTKSLCFNCLQEGHYTRNCKSTFTCRSCKGRHHTLLHQEIKSDVSTTAHVKNPARKPTRVLPTIVVPLLDEANNQIRCRLLLDTGSECNLMCSNFMKRHGLRWTNSNRQICGVGNASTNSNKIVNFQLVLPSGIKLKSFAHVLPDVTNPLPSQHLSANTIAKIESLNLADPEFFKPAKINMIVGIDLFNQLVLPERCDLGEGLFAQNTLFGWTISGSDNFVESLKSNCNFALTDETNELLQRFWELEDFPKENIVSQEEMQCEEHFKQTTVRLDDGRFSVSLPKRSNSNVLGESLNTAERRFRWLENRLDKNEDLKEQYKEFINEMIEMEHLEPVPNEAFKKKPSDVFYLPHHHVTKESTTTKLRVVFDASAKSSSGLSLNDILLVGPTIQDNLFSILMRFRMHRIALSADIAKMYRQVSLNDDDRDFHRILWRPSKEEPVKQYRMTRVIYGVASSAFHATRALQEVGNLSDDPVLQRTIKRDFYIDDLLTGADTPENACKLQQDLTTTLASFGMPLRKWTSSNVTVLQQLDDSMCELTESVFLQDPTFSIKTLGIRWFPKEDAFTFSTRPLEDSPMTKRGLLSDTASIFDPMGWLAPVTVVLKCLLQRCWIIGLDWDAQLPNDLASEWTSWRKKLSILSELRIKRTVLSKSMTSTMQLHLFTDASEIAYGAAVYLRCSDDKGSVTCTLVASKSKVAPVKTVSLPRLELCAAHLGVKLLKSIETSLSTLELPLQKSRAWTDSTIVLAWLSALPKSWKTFVANRVSEIQEALHPSHWGHVLTKDNPADLVSRGTEATQLADKTLWWRGPHWLSKNEEQWPAAVKLPEKTTLEKRENKPVVLATSESQPVIQFERFSNFNRLLRTICYCNRFLKKLKNVVIGTRDSINAQEMQLALTQLFALLQKEQFEAELITLKKTGSLSKNHPLASLTPFLGNDGLIRVGGRLLHSELPETSKHPVLLKGNHHVVTLLVRHTHAEVLHGGTQMTLAKLREIVWLIRGRDVVRHVIRKCIICFRFSSKVKQPLMGQLPLPRVTPSRPFTTTGLDFAGPFTIKTTTLRNAKQMKAFLALFVCFSTKAVHLELVSSASTAACIAALRRFVSRRGLPNVVYSDNGTNFVGAKRDLDELQKVLNNSETQKELATYATTRNFQWLTIPPRAPHFGGLWEAAIKSAKHHLRRIVGTTALTFEELTTVFTQIEAMLNSRPLQPLSEDPNDLSALTPGHFLIGAPLNSVPEIGNNMKDSRRWQLIQQMSRHFWDRWSKEYLPTQQRRNKWTSLTENLKVGDLVLMTEYNTPPMRWPLARVTKVIHGKDAVARVIEVSTVNGIFRRPAVKLRCLPLELTDEASQGGRHV